MNIWKQFETLLPKQKEIIGRIVSVNSPQGTCNVELLSGNNINVQGEGTVGAQYLIKDGVITSQMPEISSYDVTVY